MSTTTKISATEKRYSKFLGKLYWYRNPIWDEAKALYSVSYQMVMVTGLHRYGGRGTFDIKIERLEKGENQKESWRAKATIFQRSLLTGMFVPVEKSNITRPESYMSDDWHGRTKVQVEEKSG